MPMTATKDPCETFARNVLDAAKDLATPPFDGRVAIAQAYDAHGYDYPDAGSLNSFKKRLVEASRKRKIDLSRLDMPELMDRDLRQRSETPWDSDVVHFVVVAWR